MGVPKVGDEPAVLIGSKSMPWEKTSQREDKKDTCQGRTSLALIKKELVNGGRWMHTWRLQSGAGNGGVVGATAGTESGRTNENTVNKVRPT
jgi:hypothetical protein